MKKMIFRIFRKKTTKINTSMSKLFRKYPTEEISASLKELERDLSGDNKEKIKVLRKEFEKRKGISRKKKLTLAVLGILFGTIVGYSIHNYFQDKTPPKIHSVDYKFIPPDSLSLTLNATDPSGIAEVLVEVQGRNHSIPLVDGLYRTNITGGIISEIEKLPIKIYVFDKVKNCAVELLETVPSLEERFVSFALANQVSQHSAENFYSKYPELVQKLFPENKSLLMPPLKLYLQNSSIFEELHRNISQDPQITIDKNKLVSLASELFLDLGYTGKVKVLIPGSNEYREEFLSEPTIQALGNYSVAINQIGLPKHDKSTLYLLGNATQINPEIVDFEPIVLKSMDEDIVIRSNNLARDYWMIVNFLKERPEVALQPKKFEWINKMIQEMAWDIFDNRYGPRFFDKKNYKPTDQDVWQVILGFHDYMDALPAKLEKDGIEVIFPYHNSDLLKNSIPDKTNSTIALFYLADLPAKTVNQTYAAELRRLAQERKITSAEYDRLYQEKAVVKGIEGMKLLVEQLPMEYEELISARTDPTIISYPAFSGTKADWARLYYQQWLNDRAGHGLYHTVEQFKGIDKFLPEIAKFIYGYERFAFPGGEWEMYAYGLSLAYKAFGIPQHGIAARGSSGNFGGPGTYGLTEFAIYGIPQSVIDELVKQNFGRIAIGYGNGIGLFSGIDGVEKDTGYEIIQPFRVSIYLWKK